jgi:hypothetical protein
MELSLTVLVCGRGRQMAYNTADVVVGVQVQVHAHGTSPLPPAPCTSIQFNTPKEQETHYYFLAPLMELLVADVCNCSLKMPGHGDSSILRLSLLDFCIYLECLLFSFS